MATKKIDLDSKPKSIGAVNRMLEAAGVTACRLELSTTGFLHFRYASGCSELIARLPSELTYRQWSERLQKYTGFDAERALLVAAIPDRVPNPIPVIYKGLTGRTTAKQREDARKAFEQYREQHKRELRKALLASDMAEKLGLPDIEHPAFEERFERLVEALKVIRERA